MLVNLLLKPPGLVKTGKHSGILSVESGKWGVRKGNLFLYIPSWLASWKRTASSCCVVRVSVVKQEGDGRREKNENEKSREKCRYRITPNWLEFRLIFQSVRNRTGTYRNDPSKTLLEFPFNLFPLSWTVLIFTQMNGALGSKQSLPMKEPWQMYFSSICLLLSNTTFFSFKFFQELVVA